MQQNLIVNFLSCAMGAIDKEISEAEGRMEGTRKVGGSIEAPLAQAA